MSHSLENTDLKQPCKTKRGSLVTFIEVPEEEEFAPTCCGGADMTEQVDAGIPEHAVEAQHHLQTGRGTKYKQSHDDQSAYFNPKLNCL